MDSCIYICIYINTSKYIETNGWMHQMELESIAGWMQRGKHKRVTDGQLHIYINTNKYIETNGWMDGWMHGWMDGWITCWMGD